MSGTLEQEYHDRQQTCVDVFLDHMQREEEALEATLEKLRNSRRALLKRDLPELHQTFSVLNESLQVAEKMRPRREQLMEEVVASYGSADVPRTLRSVAALLPEEPRQRLLSCRARLNPLAAEINRLHVANSTLVRHSLDLVQAILEKVSGRTPGNKSYAATGRREETSDGPLFELDG